MEKVIETVQEVELSPVEKADAFLGEIESSNLDEELGEGTDPKVAIGDNPETAEKKLEEPKPEPKAENAEPERTPEELRREALALMNKANASHAAIRRREAFLESKEAEHKAQAEKLETSLETKFALREKELIASLGDVRDVVALVARNSGRSETDIWNDIAEGVRSGGKIPNRESQSSRELKEFKEELRKEKEARESERKTRESQEKLEQDRLFVSNYREAFVTMASGDEKRWPAISEMTPLALKSAAYDIASEYYASEHYAKTRQEVDQAEVLDYLEKQQSEHRAKRSPLSQQSTARAAEKKVERAKVPTNEDSSSEIPDTSDMTPEEREREADRYLHRLSKKAG